MMRLISVPRVSDAGIDYRTMYGRIYHRGVKIVGPRIVGAYYGAFLMISRKVFAPYVYAPVAEVARYLSV